MSHNLAPSSLRSARKVLIGGSSLTWLAIVIAITAIIIVTLLIRIVAITMVIMVVLIVVATLVIIVEITIVIILGCVTWSSLHVSKALARGLWR